MDVKVGQCVRTSRCDFFWAYAAIAAAIGIIPSLALGRSQALDPFSIDCNQKLAVDSEYETVEQSDSTLEFENCFRMQNLARLAERYSGRSAPQFYVDRIPAYRLGPSAEFDVPVLRVVFPERVFFDTSSARLRTEAFEAVAIIAEALRSDPPDVTVFVAGHTDSRGDSDVNFNLSIARSEAVAKELVGRRDIIANVWGIGFGEDMPLVSNMDEWSWGQNRRVEFLFSGTPKAIGVWLSDMQLDNLCVAKAGDGFDQCRREIALKDEYQAVEFVAPPADVISPDLGSTQIAIDEPSVRSIDNPTVPAETINVQRERRVITPIPGRRFKINPQRRSMVEVPST